MDNLINEQYEELEREVEEALPVEVVQSPVVDAAAICYGSEAEGKGNPVQEAIDRERLRRKLEVSQWAEELKFINKSAPKREYIEAIYNRLSKGCTIKDAIADVCSYSTWKKWQREYPELMEMEEEARQRRIWELQEKQRKIADGEDIDGSQIKPEEDSIRKITRAKLRIDTMQSEIDRYDRLTEARNSKLEKSSTLVPIQINVGYGRKQ